MTVYVAFDTRHICPKTDEVDFRYIRFAKRKDAERVLHGLPKGQRGRIVEEKEYAHVARRMDFYKHEPKPFFGRSNYYRAVEVIVDPLTGQRVTSIHCQLRRGIVDHLNARGSATHG